MLIQDIVKILTEAGIEQKEATDCGNYIWALERLLWLLDGMKCGGRGN